MSEDELQLRRAVVGVSGLVYWAGVWVQARRVRKKIRRSPNLKPREARERALWLGWLLVVLVWIGQPLMGPGPQGSVAVRFLLEQSDAAWWATGLLFMALGYAGTLWCYIAMGDTWRIGIDQRERTRLVCHGPYRWVRHPIYAFQVVILAGAALLLPTPLSLGALALHYLCVRLKAADEERHLGAVHGSAYQGYRAQTGRLLPRSIRGSDSPRPDAGAAAPRTPD
jgi:protein-S-isoprenylcysteine O-methyltransferase Ste14